MIKTISEVVQFSKEFADMNPELRDELLIKTPGYSEEEIAQLSLKNEAYANSFLKVIKNIRLDNYSLMWCHFSGFRKAYIESLVENNSDGSILSDFSKPEEYYHIASYEGDLICIYKTNNTFKCGEIVMLDHEDLDEEPQSFADDFETFIIILGNFDKITNESDGDMDIDLKKLDDVMNEFHISDKQKDTWIKQGIMFFDDEDYDDIECEE